MEMLLHLPHALNTNYMLSQEVYPYLSHVECPEDKNTMRNIVLNSP